MKSLAQMDSIQRSSTSCKRQVNRGILDLPHEMISEILCRLPTESILICRVVCKIWCAITRDPCFINTLGNSHYQPTRLILRPLHWMCMSGPALAGFLDHRAPNYQPPPNYLALLDMENQKTRRIPLEDMFRGLQIMCSCNGFLCMAPAKELDPVVIYNPITRDHLILPPSTSKFAAPSRSKFAVLHHQVGLGFDASASTYKVVRAYTGFRSRRKGRRFEIISLGESSWRELTAPQRIVNRDGLGVVFLSGALYWTMSKGTSSIFVQFDLTNEKFQLISFPRNFYARHAFMGLIEIGGIVTLLQGDSGIVRLWRIRDGGGEDELSFQYYKLYDTHVKWGDALKCEFIRQFDEESFFLQVGYRNSEGDLKEHLTQYFPDKQQYLDLHLRRLPYSFKALNFKPSLLPVPK